MAEHIEKALLDDRDLFALQYKEGLVFLEVDEYERIEFEGFSELEDIESGTSLDGGYQRLNDANGDDVLYVPSNDEFTILHVGIGIAPSMIEMFTAYPEGSRDEGEFPNLSTQPTPGANFGMVDGSDSPYRSPTIASELVIPPKQHLSFNFNNPGNDTHEPLLHIVGRKYRVNVLDPRRNKNNNAINFISKPGSRAPIKTVGNFVTKAEFNMESEWRVSPVSKENARGGER